MHQYNKTIQKMINYNDVTKENIKNHDPNWPRIPDRPYRVLLIGGSGSGKTDAWLNLIYLIEQQDDDNCSVVDKICLQVK